jgi:hypothetical protein
MENISRNSGHKGKNLLAHGISRVEPPAASPRSSSNYPAETRGKANRDGRRSRRSRSTTARTDRAATKITDDPMFCRAARGHSSAKARIQRWNDHPKGGMYPKGGS